MLSGAVQIMPGFGFGSGGGLKVRIGDNVMTTGGGAAIMERDAAGSVTMMTMNGAGPTMAGMDGPLPAGMMATVAPGGAISMTAVDSVF